MRSKVQVDSGKVVCQEKQSCGSHLLLSVSAKSGVVWAQAPIFLPSERGVLLCAPDFIDNMLSVASSLV